MSTFSSSQRSLSRANLKSKKIRSSVSPSSSGLKASGLSPLFLQSGSDIRLRFLRSFPDALSTFTLLRTTWFSIPSVDLEPPVWQHFDSEGSTSVTKLTRSTNSSQKNDWEAQQKAISWEKLRRMKHRGKDGLPIPVLKSIRFTGDARNLV